MNGNFEVDTLNSKPACQRTQIFDWMDKFLLLPASPQFIILFAVQRARACVRPLSFDAARYHAEGPELFLKTHIGSNSPVSVDMQPSFNGKLFNLLIFPMYSPKAGNWYD
jgi:hypothetical protein